MPVDGKFYLGRPSDLLTGKTSTEPVLYDPADLTTHAVVTGMTGSGKTGLCIALMEEAALQGIPAIIIDPKGDLTNLLLHFPNLAPADFQPWLDAESVRRQGKPLEKAAAETAAAWQQGLAEWGIGSERLRALANSTGFAVFTPGSDAGLKVSVVSSLEAPPVPWEGNREVLREKISATVIALLGLVGMEDIDPVRSREHILLSSIFEHAWSSSLKLNLDELILQTQTPPFQKLGAFDVDAFFPPKARMELAMLLNNIYAAPSFETWREGTPLDIPAMLYDADGRPRHSIFYIAHLSDAERMFFVTLLLSAVETWMRTQAGSGALRALVYFDEIYGYLPPQSNPPSKAPLLRMLKQARAFGVGLLLATQNPVDLDYKGLSNAGTWFVGKLQTERDKERLLDGLESISGGLDRQAYARTIASLGKRVFLLHNVHAAAQVVFQTRWAMNFLAGPLTRAQIPALNTLAGAEEFVVQTPGTDAAPQPPVGLGAAGDWQAAPQPAPAQQAMTQPGTPTGSKTPPRVVSTPGTATRPAVPSRVDEFFLPLTFSLTEAFRAAGETPAPGAAMTGVLYRPTLLASARVRLQDRRYNLDTEQELAALVDTLDKRGVADWDEVAYHGPSLERLEKTSAPQASYDALPAALTDEKLLENIRRDFTDWVYREAKAAVRVNRALKVTAGPGVSQAEFLKQCAEAARAGRDAELEKLTPAFERRQRTLKDRLQREGLELEADQDELSSRKSEAFGTQADAVLGIFRRGNIRRLTRISEKNRLKEKARADVEESKVTIENLKEQVAALEGEQQRAAQEIQDRWSNLVDDVDEISITPGRDDIFVERFGVAWMPFYLVKAGENLIELPAFGGE